MGTMTAIKKDMDFNRGLSSLIEALKNIAVSQYRALEHRFRSFDKFPKVLEGYCEFIDFSKVRHSFITPKNKSKGVVVVTSDSGLLGGLNRQVVATGVAELEDDGQLIVVGSRGKVYARELGATYVAFPGVSDEERHFQALQLRDYLYAQILGNKFGILKVVYPRPISFTVQRVEVVNFLPFVPEHAFGHINKAEDNILKNVIFESKISDIVEYMVYLWMGYKLFEIFGLSRLSEFAARYVHLEDSLRRLKETDGKLKLKYFRLRHEIIDQSMRELFSARLLYSQ